MNLVADFESPVADKDGAEAKRASLPAEVEEKASGVAGLWLLFYIVIAVAAVAHHHVS